MVFVIQGVHQGRTSFFDNEKLGYPLSSRNPENIELVSTLVNENRPINIKQLQLETGISYGSIETILTKDLELTRVAARFVPKILRADEIQARIVASRNLIKKSDRDPEWMNTIITGDETWVYCYDPETKRNSSEWRGKNESRPKKPRLQKSRMKTLLSFFRF